MSSMLPAGFEPPTKPVKVTSQDDGAPLTSEELQLQRRLFSAVESLPDKFKGWVPEFMGVNGLPISYSQVQGLSRFAFGQGTSLPTAPTNAQFFSVTVGDGVVWSFRYNAVSSSAYKWEFVGGPPLINEVASAEATTNGFYSDLSTDGPTITVPLAGEYIANLTARVQTSATDRCFVGLYVNGGLDSETSIDLNGSWYGALQLVSPVTISAANQIVKMRYQNVNGFTSTYSNRLLLVTPVRVA